MTIAAFLKEMKARAFPAWRETPIDLLLHGDPSRELRGVAVAMMATQGVLEEAERRALNLVLSHEPLFYNHQGALGFLAGDPVYQAKRAYLDSRGIAVFHLHDNAHRPGAQRGVEGDGVDMIAAGMARRLGWEGYASDGSFTRFDMPGITLNRITRQLRSKLRPQALRWIGDGAFAYGSVLSSWGFMGAEGAVRLAGERESCVVVTGETHEWEFAAYAKDAAALGFRKALVIVGHIPSEEAGFESLRDVLAPLFPEIPIAALRTGELFAQRAPAAKGDRALG